MPHRDDPGVAARWGCTEESTIWRLVRTGAVLGFELQEASEPGQPWVRYKHDQFGMLAALIDPVNRGYYRRMSAKEQD